MLYGDGIHDDTAALQELLDNGGRLVEFPMPREKYLISAPLRIHSRQELRLPAFAELILKEGSNCLMLTNADWETGNSHIVVSGGVWNQNNRKQQKNPVSDIFGTGICVEFMNVEHLRLSDITMKDPIAFGITLDTVSYFTVENIVFDYNTGNPWAINMDGVHLNGNCHYGKIANLQGACYDDLVALNADEGSAGPISHVDIDGIYATHCHSAVRLLSASECVTDVHIHNVFGEYFQYCIGVTKYYPRSKPAFFSGLSFDNIFACKAERLTVYAKDGTYVYPLIYVEEDLTVKDLWIRDVHRVEKTTAIPTVFVGEGTVVESLSLADISVENQTGERMPLVDNRGVIGRLTASNLRCGEDEMFAGTGEYPKA